MVYLCSASFPYLLKSVSGRVMDMVIKFNKDAFVKLIYFANSVPVKFIKETRFLQIFDYCSGNDKKYRSHPGTDIKRATGEKALSLILNCSFSKDEAITSVEKLLMKHVKSSGMIKVGFYDS